MRLEALLGLLTPHIYLKLCCLGITGNFMMILSCMSNFIDLAYSPWPSLPPFFFPTIPKQRYKTKTNRKNNRNKSHKVFWMKTSACRDGILKKQPN